MLYPHPVQTLRAYPVWGYHAWSSRRSCRWFWSPKIPDLSVDDAYCEFGPAARAAGMAAVFTFPLRHGEDRLGDG